MENMSMIGGLVAELKNRTEYKDGKAGLIVLDSGDQFQGTLLSNYDEGETVFKIFNTIGYDAIIPGNHDYDFGPKNWQYDRVTPGVTSNNPREVLEHLVGFLNCPMLSANTYLRKTIKITGSQIVIPLNDSCEPRDQSLAGTLDFENANRPNFLAPYRIIERVGIKIALIGIDHHLTTSVTTGENVSDFCFRDEAEAYLDVRSQLEGQADIFVMLLHNGDAPPNNFTASAIAERILAKRPGAVDLVAAGHTHQVHNNAIGNNVRVIQSGANATQYGRVDLYVDPVTKKVIADQTDSAAGILAVADTCDTKNAEFVCKQYRLPISSVPEIDALVTQAQENLAVMAKKKIAFAKEEVKRSRTGESALGNIMADALRNGAKTQIAFMNAGGIRTNLKKGDILYENLFEVTPFGNLVVVIDALPWKNLKSILNKTITTDGNFGTLMQSGLRIKYSSSDSDPVTQLFRKSELLHVELEDGTLLFDKELHFDTPDSQTFSVATIDFLVDGGNSFDFSGGKVSRRMKIARDVIAEVFLSTTPPPTLENKVDHRFVNVAKDVTTR